MKEKLLVGYKDWVSSGSVAHAEFVMTEIIIMNIIILMIRCTGASIIANSAISQSVVWIQCLQFASKKHRSTGNIFFTDKYQSVDQGMGYPGLTDQRRAEVVRNMIE